ncbi:PAS domain-containing protein [Maridesulfovibrio sp.]|uniref:PAS domain-containing sensor histidine kinase n=1 Tax=Maridesulfovibrio sp. TaxID=2795000 RepID=UPI002A187E77|nr:PAS domain-containing protein [Maridesulfovibrio sp.]
MVLFDQEIIQVVEAVSRHCPGVVVALDAGQRVVFVGGENAGILSGIICPGDYLGSGLTGGIKGFGSFVDGLTEAESSFSGFFANSSGLGGEITWHGSRLEDGSAVLRGFPAGSVNGLRIDNECSFFDPKGCELFVSTLLGNLPGMVYRCRNDVDWTMELVSPGCLDLTGYTPEALLNNRDISYADLIFPEYRAHVWECVQEAVQEFKHYEIVYKIRTFSGEAKWVREKGMEVHRPDGSVVLEGFITDVTPLMEMEQTLHQSEDRLRAMAGKTGQMVYDMDLGTGEILWSGAVPEITGYSEPEFSSVDFLGWERLIHPEDRPRAACEIDSGIVDGQHFVSVYRIRQKNGSYLYVEVESDFILNAGGKAVRMLGTVKNCSDKVNMQKLMLQSEKMTSVASLSAGMAHEINNPLGVISQSAQNIERRFSPQLAANLDAARSVGVSLDLVNRYLEKRKVTAMLDAIKNASQRAARIILNMLDFSSSSESREPCDMGEIVDRVLEMCAADFTAESEYDFRKIRVVKEISSDLPEIACFRGEMEQVLFNLLRNSAQALSLYDGVQDDPLITIRLFQNRQHIVLQVEDNGPGVDESTRKRMFEPFFSTRSSDPGNGLGLSIVEYIIVRNHGGEISVESEPGEGVKISVYLPKGAASCSMQDRP